MKNISMRASCTLSGIALVVAVMFSSCTKQGNNVDPSVFSGTWNGTLTCTGMQISSAQVVIGIDGSNATIAGTAGYGSCAKSATFNGTVFNDHLEFALQTIVDACGNTNTMSGSVYYNDNTISLSEYFTGPMLTTHCSFTGSK